MSNGNDNSNSSNSQQTHEYLYNMNLGFDSAFLNLLHPPNNCNLSDDSQIARVSPLLDQTSMQSNEMTNYQHFSSLYNTGNPIPLGNHGDDNLYLSPYFNSLPPIDNHSRQVFENISFTGNPFSFPNFPNVSHFSNGPQHQYSNVTNPLFHVNSTRTNEYYPTESFWQAGVPLGSGKDFSGGFSGIDIHTLEAKNSTMTPDFTIIPPSIGKETFVGYNQSNPNSFFKSIFNDSKGNSSIQNQDFLSEEFRNFVRYPYEGSSSTSLHGACSRITSGSGNRTIDEDGNNHQSSKRARAIVLNGSSSSAIAGRNQNQNLGNHSSLVKINSISKRQMKRPSPIQVPPAFDYVSKLQKEIVSKGRETQDVELSTGASERTYKRLKTQVVQQSRGDSSGTDTWIGSENVHPNNGASSRMELSVTPEFISRISINPAWWRKHDNVTTAVLNYVFNKKEAETANEQVEKNGNGRKRKASVLEKK